MTTHKKLAERIRSVADERKACRAFEDKYAGTWLDDVARAFLEGDFDDILGVREPTQKDVEAQILRAFGENSNVLANGGHVFRGGVLVEGVAYTHRASKTIVWVRDTAAAYAALRTYPDHKETET